MMKRHQQYKYSSRTMPLQGKKKMITENQIKRVSDNKVQVMHLFLNYASLKTKFEIFDKF